MNDFADKGDAATRAALAAGREPRLRPAQASRWLRGVARPEAVTLALLALAVLVSARLSPYFADLRFVLESATFYVELAMLALVLTPIIIAGEIDLSPASQSALCACVYAVLWRAGWPAGAAIGAAVATGLGCGALNALLVVRWGLPSIIATIGTLILYRGLAQILVGDRSIGAFPAWFNGVDQRTVGVVPWPVLGLVALAAVLQVWLARTLQGRQIYQCGTNRLAARHAGIAVDRIHAALFVAMGGASALAGLLAASRLGSVRYDLATGGELTVVLIVMLGGTSIFGGRGSILGTFIASCLLAVIATGMTVANIPADAQLAVLGLLLIVAVVAGQVMRSGRLRSILLPRSRRS